jgi:hypothetical protein
MKIVYRTFTEMEDGAEVRGNLQVFFMAFS